MKGGGAHRNIETRVSCTIMETMGHRSCRDLFFFVVFRDSLVETRKPLRKSRPFNLRCLSFRDFIQHFPKRHPENVTAAKMTPR